MRYARETRGNVEIIHLLEREATYHSGVESFSRRLVEIAHESGLPIVVDFGAVHYVDMSMIVTIMGAARDLRREGNDLAVCGMTAPTLQSTFDLAGLQRFVQCYRDTDEAITRMNVSDISAAQNGGAMSTLGSEVPPMRLCSDDNEY